MDDLCITCLCAGRNLISIAGTELQHIYLQMLNEPITKMLEPYLHVCWECRAILKRFQLFKNQTQQCYAELWQHTQQGLEDSIVKHPHLQVQNVISLSFNIPKEETHVEPDTFVDEIKLEKEKQVCKRKAKLKRTPKMKIKNEKIKKEVRRPSSDVSEVEHDDPFVESEPVSEIECKECDKMFDTQEQLVIHTAEEHVAKVKTGVKRTRSKEILPDKPQCVECGKMFSSRKTYRYHLKSEIQNASAGRGLERAPPGESVLHKGQNRYPCPRCGKVYQWKSNLGRHMRSHKALDSGELYCDICDKKFASVATFRQHLRGSRRHVSETDFSFMCNECGKKFVNKTRLRDHIDWEHLNKIKFKCQLCNKPFKCHTSLYVHLQNVHRNKEKKDNLCHVCGKSYQNAAKLRYHIVAMHTTETPYRCERCGAAFGWYSSLYRHVREVHHKMKVQPKKCKKTKKLSDDLPTPHLTHQLGPVE